MNGEGIRAGLRAQGLTQKQLAERCYKIAQGPQLRKISEIVNNPSETIESEWAVAIEKVLLQNWAKASETLEPLCKQDDSHAICMYDTYSVDFVQDRNSGSDWISRNSALRESQSFLNSAYNNSCEPDLKAIFLARQASV